MTRGGGFYPATGVLDIYEDTEDTACDEDGSHRVPSVGCFDWMIIFHTFVS